jgi:hypothetical protein
MAVAQTSPDTGVGRAWKYYAGGAGLINLTTVANKPQRCARRIVFLAAGAVAHLKDSGGNDEPLAAVLAGMAFDADVSAVDSAVAMIVFW